jgi:hypothetical protein
MTATAAATAATTITDRTTSSLTTAVAVFLLKDFCFIMGKRFACPNDAENYVGRNVSF